MKKNIIIIFFWIKLEIKAFIRSQSKNLRIDKSSKNLLFFAFHLPPVVNGGIYRPLSLMKVGRQLGWSVTAVTARPEQSHPSIEKGLAPQIPDVANLYRVPYSLRANGGDCFLKIDGGFLRALATAQYVLKRMKKSPDVIFATGPKFTFFVAAFFLSRIFNTKLVLDFRDEWWNCPFRFVRSGRFDYFWEKRCLHAADLIVFTTESHRKRCLKSFKSINKDKIHVIPNGFEKDFQGKFSDNLNLVTFSKVRADKIVLTFTGFLAGYNSIAGLLNTLALLLDAKEGLRERLTIHLVGKQSKEELARIKAFRYSQCIKFTPLQPLDKMPGMFDNCSALFTCGKETLSSYMPGKIAYYLASKKPIILYGCQGEASNLVLRLKAGVFVPAGDVNQLEKALDLVSNTDPNKWNSKEREQWCSLHTREILGKKYFDLMEDLIRV